jgi:hypothetical protein
MCSSPLPFSFFPLPFPLDIEWPIYPLTTHNYFRTQSLSRQSFPVIITQPINMTISKPSYFRTQTLNYSILRYNTIGRSDSLFN